MPTLIEDYAADHKFLVAAAARAANIVDPVPFNPRGHLHNLLSKAVRGPLVPIGDTLLRDWLTGGRQYWPGTQFGIRLYTVAGITFARVVAALDTDVLAEAFDFCVVARADYVKLFRFAVRVSRERDPSGPPPVMHADQFETLRQNTLGYLNRDNLRRIKELGGRAKRGLLMTGPPGNGKTSACRYLWEECQRLGHEYQVVSPDAYQAARRSCNPVEAVKALFTVNRRGIIFFDDMDVALRDRNTVKETDDQAVFLSALDGIEVHEGVVYVFTTNCAIDLIDPAFKRPGRIDLVMHFRPPTPELRRELMNRWHAEILAGIDLDAAVDDTNGFTFAEVEELKNLLIMRFVDVNEWDWNWATRQYRANRDDLAKDASRTVGFGFPEPARNGHN